MIHTTRHRPNLHSSIPMRRWKSSYRWRLGVLAPLADGDLSAVIEPIRDQVEVLRPATRKREDILDVLRWSQILIADFPGGLSLTTHLIAAAPNLLFVQHPSVGVDGTDLEAATAAGVAVANTPGVNAISVAEWSVGMAITLTRRLFWASDQVRAGQWPFSNLLGTGRDLAGTRVGILGMGDVGLACADRFTAMGCEVAYWSRTLRQPEQTHGARYLPFNELLASSEILIVALALTPATRGCLGQAQLALMPASSYLINVARGPILDDAALIRLLDCGHLAGAALDVFDQEPPEIDSPLRTHPKIIPTPHVAGTTADAFDRILAGVSANLARVVNGQQPHHVVNNIPLRLHTVTRIAA
jgi:D-3-phosphoglycerate dehydrogenase